MRKKTPLVFKVLVETRWRLFRFFGIDVFVSPFVFITLGLISWSLSLYFEKRLMQDFAGVFSDPGLVGWFLSPPTGVLLFSCVLIHEFAHSLLARAYGLKVSGITLFIFGGVSAIDDLDKATPKQTFFVAAIGPAASAVLGVVFFGALVALGYFTSNPDPLLVIVYLLVYHLLAINIMLAVFNSLPVYPLDGGRMLLSLFRIFGLKKSTAENIAINLGIFAWNASFAVGMLMAWLFRNPSLIWFALIGLMMGAMAFAEKAQIEKARKQEKEKSDA